MTSLPWRQADRGGCHRHAQLPLDFRPRALLSGIIADAEHRARLCRQPSSSRRRSTVRNNFVVSRGSVKGSTVCEPRARCGLDFSHTSIPVPPVGCNVRSWRGCANNRHSRAGGNPVVQRMPMTSRIYRRGLERSSSCRRQRLRTGSPPARGRRLSAQPCPVFCACNYSGQ